MKQTNSSSFVNPGARERYRFEEIRELLSSPEMVSEFMKNNVRYDAVYDSNNDNEYPTPRAVYERGVDDCDVFVVS